jgi:thioredoxin 1
MTTTGPNTEPTPATPADQLATLTGTVLLAFGARWCGPWRLLTPVLERLRTDGHQVLTVDVDEHPGFADRWAVVSLPTFVVVRDGSEIRRWLGAVSGTDLAAGLVRRSVPVKRKGNQRRRR